MMMLRTFIFTLFALVVLPAQAAWQLNGLTLVEVDDADPAVTNWNFTCTGSAESLTLKTLNKSSTALDLSTVEADTGAKIVTLGSKLFESQSAIKSFVLPSTLKTIFGSCFRGTGSGSLVVPEGMTSLSSQCFYKSGFTEIILPNTLKSIAAKAFQQMSSLTTLTLPRSLTSIAANAFDRSSKFKTLYWETCPASLGSAFGFSGSVTHYILRGQWDNYQETAEGNSFVLPSRSEEDGSWAAGSWTVSGTTHTVRYYFPDWYRPETLIILQ